MSNEERFGNFFKSENKSSGIKLIQQNKVSVSTHSDTRIQAYIKATPPIQVKLYTEAIESKSFTAECSCPVAQKSQFCKHIWAVLLEVSQNYPDFLSEKQSIEKPTLKHPVPPNARKARKELTRKQKGREKPTAQTRFAPNIEHALDYFLRNGFPMPDGPTEEALREAKKKLSRVFHPDKGGSHEEVAELNQNCDILLEFLKV